MLDLAVNVLMVLAYGLPALSLVAWYFRANAVERTPLRYILKTCEIALIGAAIVVNICFFGIEAYLATEPLQKALVCTGGALLVVFWLRALLQIIRDDDDDWFNDRWKKLKRGFKKLRARLQTKPVLSPAPI
jgi:arginine exporter protein ArgO